MEAICIRSSDVFSNVDHDSAAFKGRGALMFEKRPKSFRERLKFAIWPPDVVAGIKRNFAVTRALFLLLLRVRKKAKEKEKHMNNETCNSKANQKCESIKPIIKIQSQENQIMNQKQRDNATSRIENCLNHGELVLPRIKHAATAVAGVNRKLTFEARSTLGQHEEQKSNHQITNCKESRKVNQILEFKTYLTKYLRLRFDLDLTLKPRKVTKNLLKELQNPGLENKSQILTIEKSQVRKNFDIKNELVCEKKCTHKIDKKLETLTRCFDERFDLMRNEIPTENCLNSHETKKHDLILKNSYLSYALESDLTKNEISTEICLNTHETKKHDSELKNTYLSYALEFSICSLRSTLRSEAKMNRQSKSRGIVDARILKLNAENVSEIFLFAWKILNH